jgi:hypothetical protein
VNFAGILRLFWRIITFALAEDLLIVADFAGLNYRRL